MGDVIIYYWPRLIVSLLFALFSLRVSKVKYSVPRQIVRGIIFFLLSGPVVSIFSEIFNYRTFNLFIKPNLKFENSTVIAIFGLYCIVLDVLAFIIPIYLYSKILGDVLIISATTYIQFVLQDRFAYVISQDAKGYVIIYAIAFLIIAFVHGRDVDYISKHLDSLNWMPVLLYNIALFVLIDTCYGAYYFFSELQYDKLSIPMIWLDSIIIIACIFASGFAKLNVHLSKEHSNRLEYMQKFQDSQTDIIRDFASISEAKSGETGEHIRRVSEYTAILAKEFFDDEKIISYIKVASMMHDIGKLMIPNNIIEKKGKLTADEYEIIKTHSSYGDSLLSHNEGEIMTIAREIAHEHHERWDGKGYPRGLKGDAISIYAQIVSVADVYDALTSKRSYKEAWPPEEAFTEIVRQKGFRFSPRVVEAFVKNYSEIEEIRNKYVDK